VRPKQIRVFDGLRITTEHITHLQGALNSGVQDLREIQGAGRVYRGFQVSAANEKLLTVQPGLAFDAHCNRLTSDEPIKVPVTWDTGDTTQYVYLKYDQIETGEVGGKSVLLWDSCSVVVHKTLPEPAEKENLLPIAKIRRSTEGVINVESLVGLLAREGEVEGPPDKKDQAKPADSPPPTRSIHVHQGRVNFPRQPLVNSSLLAALKTRLGQGELQLPLAASEIDTASPVVSLTCHIIITIYSTGNAPSVIDDPLSMEDKNSRAILQCVASGEAVFNNEGISQLGISSVYFYSDASAASVCINNVTERGLAFLPLQRWNGSVSDVESHVSDDVKRTISFLVGIDKTSRAGFKINCYLLKGPDGDIETFAKDFEAHANKNTWGADVIWKALVEG
jgi:hypothetical protein